MSLTDLCGRFRDEAQRRRVQAVIHDRFADDREQDECRYVMRFWWQLVVSYQEVTLQDLREHVGDDKFAAIYDLVCAIRSAPSQVDVWIEWAEERFAIADDRGFYQEIDRWNDQTA